MGITNLGAVGISAGGAYNPGTVYKKYKVVSANGGSYMYINPTPAAGVPVTDTSHWQQIAAQGLKGDTGDVTPAAEAARDLAEGYAISTAEAAALVANKAEKTDTINIASEIVAETGEELLTADGWVLGEGWSGSLAVGFEHTIGNTETLEFPLTTEVGKNYLVEFSVTGDTPTEPGNFTVGIGATPVSETYKGGSGTISYSVGVLVSNAGNLIITPLEGFVGTIAGLSVKEVTGSIAASTTVEDSAGNTLHESRNTTASNKNVFNGFNSGKMCVSGFGNVGAGAETLAKLTSGFWNTALGLYAGNSIVDGSRNTLIGYNAGKSTKSANRNVAIGSWALGENTSGSRNIAIGSDALMYNITGKSNVAIGPYSMSRQQVSEWSVAIGQSALDCHSGGSPKKCVAIGAFAGALTSGDSNVFVGFNAGKNSLTGDYNVFINGIAPKDSGGNYISALSNYLNINGFIRGGAYNNQITVGDSSEYLAKYDSYNPGTKIQINDGTSSAIFQGVSARNYNDSLLGAIEFVNAANSGVDAAHRCECAYITSNVVSIDTNSGKDAGANLRFFTKTAGDLKNLRLEIAHDGKIGINKGTDAITAWLHLGAGVSSVPPLKLTNGTLTNTPQSGAIEYDGTNLYFTNAAGERKTLAVTA